MNRVCACLTCILIMIKISIWPISNDIKPTNSKNTDKRDGAVM